MPKELFKKVDLIDLAYEDSVEGFTLVMNDLVDVDRWNKNYDLVFKYGGRFFRSSYSMGATECQDESPYEFEEDLIECEEVVPQEKVVTIYVPID